MINLLWNTSENYKPKYPIVLEVGEIKEYDFNDCANHIFHIFTTLQLCGLVYESPYFSPEDVLEVIQNLVDDIDLNSDELQISEFKHIRVEFRDEMLVLEFFVGV